MNNIRVGVVSLGCSKNQVDTEILLGMLKDCGYIITPNPDEADVIIVNTCGFIESAKLESIETILEMEAYKSKKCKLLCATGCLTQRYPDINVEMPEIDVIWGVRSYDDFVRRLNNYFGLTADITCDGRRILTTPHYSAYLRISDGCSNRCAYCAIPLIRGDNKSVPMDELISTAEQLADNGVTELNIIAQDTSVYGRDLYGRLMLPELLRELSKIEKLKWLRVLYAYPDTVTDELINEIVSNPKVVNYLDIPIQHINDRLLLSMNRRGTSDDIKSMIKKLRTLSPDFIIRTSLIVGFPGETDEEFNELLDFLSEYRINRVGAFTYSREEDTPAFDFENQIDEEIKEARLDKLMSLQSEISRELNESRIGSEVTMLIESIDDEVTIGRSYAEAPEVDGKLILPESVKAHVGDYIDVIITGASGYDLEVKLKS